MSLHTALGRYEQGHSKELTVSRDIHPDSVLVKCVLVRVETLQRVLISRVIAVHGSVVLVPEDYPRAGDTFSGGFGTLSAQGLLLVALQLALTASKTVVTVSIYTETMELAHTIRFVSAYQGSLGLWVNRSYLRRYGLVTRHVGIEGIHKSRRAKLCYLYQYGGGRQNVHC